MCLNSNNDEQPAKKKKKIRALNNTNELKNSERIALHKAYFT